MVLLLGSAVTSTGEEKVTFNDHVLPIFRNACLKLPQSRQEEGGARSVDLTATLQGVRNGKVVQSVMRRELALQVREGHEEPKMPPKGDR
jgi:hypothetical protein